MAAEGKAPKDYQQARTGTMLQAVLGGSERRDRKAGRLAQLVQSAWFTPRRSQVRILYRPLINGRQWVHE